MDSKSEHDTPIQDLETQETEARSSSTLLSAPEITREVIGKILSTNFAYFMGGLNGITLEALVLHLQQIFCSSTSIPEMIVC